MFVAFVQRAVYYLTLPHRTVAREDKASMMKMVRTRSAVAGLLLLCEILVYTSGSERPSSAFCDEGAQQSTAVGSSPWDTYAKSSLLTPESFDESRVAVLIPLHPPKFEMAERYFDSARHSGAAAEIDTYILLSPEDDAKFHSRFPHFTSGPGQYTHIVENSGVAWIDNLNKSKGPPDVPVRKKLQVLAQFYDRIIDGALPTRYRYIVIPDSEIVWARNATGFAAAVARHGADPVWYGNCQTAVAEKHQVRNSWYTFAQNLRDGDEYAAALARLQDRCRSAYPVNTHFVELPVYDAVRLPRYLAFLNTLTTVCNEDGTTCGAFEQPLYVDWVVAIDGHGRVDSSVESPSSNQYSWLSRMRWKSDGTLWAYDPSMQLLKSTGVLWAPLHVIETGSKCATLPPSVYILFNTDYSESRAKRTKRTLLYPPCCDRARSWPFPPYCSAYRPTPWQERAEILSSMLTPANNASSSHETAGHFAGHSAARQSAEAALQNSFMSRPSAPMPMPMPAPAPAPALPRVLRSMTGEEMPIEQCLADGRGRWMSLESPRKAPYDLQLSPFFSSWNTSRWWWGKCGPEYVTETWVPARCSLPEMAALRTEFCQKFAGKNILLVGDSVQGQLFTSLVSMLGASVEHIQFGKCERLGGADEQFRNYMRTFIAKNHHEYSLRATACSNATISFLRNEVLALELTNSELKDRRTRPNLHRKEFMCDWREAAARASVVVLNRGMHQVPGVPHSLHPLGDIFRYLGRNGPTSPSVIYRSTHAPRCDGKLELNVADNSTVAYAVEAQYNWKWIQGQNAKDQLEVEKHGGRFLDVYSMSLQNGKSKMKSAAGALDCVHGCLPGPLDEWARALLTLLNITQTAAI